MGRNRATRHQKFLKSEKAKVKLKAKKELPKGTNETKTSFKVKKIVIKEHKTPGPGVPVIKSNLSLKDLLSRLQHFNTNSRVEALNGIKELMKHNEKEVTLLNLRQLLSGICALVLDKERSVRREAYQTLSLLLAPLSSDKVSPFFDILCSYLRCAMTHINTRIHEDSLFYFDVLLNYLPDLVVQNEQEIFPRFLDMISKLRVDSKPGRMLSMNLDSKMTTVKWRTKVLLRLLQFLRMLVNLKLGLKDFDIIQNYKLHKINSLTGDKNMFKPSINFDENNATYFPIYKNITSLKLSCFSKEKDASAEEMSDIIKIQNYIETLMPLLFDTWLEVRPENSIDNRAGSIVTEDGIIILQYILEIMVLLWQILIVTERESSNNTLNRWFNQKYLKSFIQHFMINFPYTSTKMKRQDIKDKLSQSSNDAMCLLENLRICYIYIALIEHEINDNSHENSLTMKILNYIEDVLDCISNDHTCQFEMIAIFTLLLKNKKLTKLQKLEDIISKLIHILAKKNDFSLIFSQNMFESLCGILLSDNLIDLQNTKSFQNWLCFLLKTLWEENNVSLKTFDAITKFAIRNNAIFNDCIKEKLCLIIKNLPHIMIRNFSNEFESSKKVINLLYWINCWNTESLNILQDQLGGECYPLQSKEYLVDILKLKTEGLIPL